MIFPVVRILIRAPLIANIPQLRVLSAITIGFALMMLVSGDLGTNRLFFFFAALLVIAANLNRQVEIVRCHPARAVESVTDDLITSATD
jgi:hypothetical protein